MDTAAIKTGLPAAVVSAVSDNPEGLTANSQVYVATGYREPASDEEVFVREPEGQPEVLPGTGFDGVLERYSLELHMYSVDGAADLTKWRDGIIEAFHGKQNPSSVTGMLACSVEEIGLRHPESGPASLLDVLLTWTGWE